MDINKQTWCSALKRWRVVCVSFKNQVPFLWAPPFLPPLLSGLEDLSNDCTYAPWWQLGSRKYIDDITTSTTSLFFGDNEGLKTYFSRHLFSPLRNTSSSFCLGPVFDPGAWLDMWVWNGIWKNNLSRNQNGQDLTVGWVWKVGYWLLISNKTLLLTKAIDEDSVMDWKTFYLHNRILIFQVNFNLWRFTP